MCPQIRASLVGRITANMNSNFGRKLSIFWWASS
jgi:hypothetical protein